MKVNEAARAMGKKGGKSRMASMTPAERLAFAMKGVLARKKAAAKRKRNAE